MHPGPSPHPLRGRSMPKVTFNDHLVRFLTSPELTTAGNPAANAWQTLVNSLNPTGMTSADILLRHLRRLADLFIRTSGFGGSSPPATPFLTVRTALLGQILPAMSQGSSSAPPRRRSTDCQQFDPGRPTGRPCRKSVTARAPWHPRLRRDGLPFRATRSSPSCPPRHRERHGAFSGTARISSSRTTSSELNRAPA
jgi:hypothetical protein